jgi:hypothetical protein
MVNSFNESFFESGGQVLSDMIQWAGRYYYLDCRRLIL